MCVCEYVFSIWGVMALWTLHGEGFVSVFPQTNQGKSFIVTALFDTEMDIIFFQNGGLFRYVARTFLWSSLSLVLSPPRARQAFITSSWSSAWMEKKRLVGATQRHNGGLSVWAGQMSPECYWSGEMTVLAASPSPSAAVSALRWLHFSSCHYQNKSRRKCWHAR